MQKSILVLCAIALFCSCRSSKIQSLAMVGNCSYHIKYNFIGGKELTELSDFELHENEDTLFVLSFLNNTPFEGLYIFENDKCSFQELNIYCSPCADKAIDDIIDNKNYKFQAVDPINYLAS